jgi:hypothetical protein
MNIGQAVPLQVRVTPKINIDIGPTTAINSTLHWDVEQCHRLVPLSSDLLDETVCSQRPGLTGCLCAGWSSIAPHPNDPTGNVPEIRCILESSPHVER